MWQNEFNTQADGDYWMLFFEPLDVQAPADARPHSCYLNTVIFYKQPWESDGKGGYAEFGRAETKWNLLGERWTDADLGWRALAPLVSHAGRVYKIASGRIIWAHGQWFMQWRGHQLSEHDEPLYSSTAAQQVVAHRLPTGFVPQPSGSG